MRQYRLVDISDETEIFIYGAGNNTNALIPYLIKYFHNVKILAILVSDEYSLDGIKFDIPVLHIGDVPDNQKNKMVIISTNDKYLAEIELALSQFRFQRYIIMTFESESLENLRIMAIRDIFKNEGNEFLMTDDILHHKDLTYKMDKSISINMIKCHLDTELKKTVPNKCFEYLAPLQVGTDLTDIRVARRTDNTGDNISELNQQYCELTGTYWIWKNDRSDIKGLCHYRRLFKLTEDQIKYLFDNGVDAILTVPILCQPNVRAIYKRDHNINDWDCMMETIRKCAPSYYEFAKRMEESEYYYGYNMVIARRKVFDDYCNFLFPVLNEVKKKADADRTVHEETYQKRYIGFLAERLTSLYFTSHKEYMVVSARKMFLR